ncbi:MAG: Card1-like endonuclease domain-containing protein [Bacteroidota bacterium]
MSKILINLIGKETIPNYHAYKEIQPDILIQVYSDFSKKASNILASMVNGGLTEVVSIECDGWNFIDLLEKLKSSIKLLPNDQLFVNVTGGTKMMALPVYEFAKEQLPDVEVKLFYTTTNSEIVWFLEKNHVEKLQTKLSIQELISLQNQKINFSYNFNETYEKFKDYLPVIEKQLLKSSSPWNKFLKYVNQHIRIDEENKNQTLLKVSETLNSKQELFFIKIEKDEVEILYKEVSWLKFNLTETEVLWFLIDAGWFELMVANKLVDTYPDHEILLNVVFNFRSNQKLVRNEVDVLMCDGNKLIFIECKSGNIKSKDIDAIKIRKEVYGGLIGDSILVGRYPLNPTSKHLKEKIKEYGIKHKLLAAL